MQFNQLNYISNSFQLVNQSSNNLKTINLNFGPQHPSAHGVLRLILKLKNEVIENTDIHIGLLHRGTEKLMEQKIFIHSLPYFDRLDYVSTLLQEHSYCLAIDSLLKKKNYTSPLVITRCIYDEFTRIFNHLLAIACHALDVGSMSPIFWAFEEREKIMEFFERISGARMHTAFYRPVLKSKVLNNDLLFDMGYFSNNCLITLNEIHNILTNNKVWKIRLKNIGQYNINTCLSHNLTGIMARCVGVERDLRLDPYTTYNNYYYLNFNSFTTDNGDSYDRFLLRLYEMLESLQIINQNLTLFNTLSKYSNDLISSILDEQNSMENLISHFKFWSEGFIINSNIIYQPVESPKGEFGVSLISDNSSKPFRCKIKSPSLNHLFLLKFLTKNVFLADLVTLIGTIDIVFGEIDR